jgi:preprotein translocase subunit SecE
VASAGTQPGTEGRMDEMAQAAKAAKPNIVARLTRYFNDVKAEMKRVVWPNRPEIVNMSLVVIVTLIVMVLYVGSLDFLSQNAITLLAGIGR